MVETAPWGRGKRPRKVQEIDQEEEGERPEGRDDDAVEELRKGGTTMPLKNFGK
jgi:hypothetical protein